jgi:peptidyl-prolyl cis-trans isomerase B (cyclophilin B)
LRRGAGSIREVSLITHDDQHDDQAATRKASAVAGKQDRQRKLARERFERQQQRRIERAHRVRQRMTIGGAACAVIAIAVGAYFWASSGSGKAAAASPTPKPTASASTAASPVNIPAASPLATVPTTAPKVAPATHCTYTSNPPAARKVSFPPSTPDSSGKSQATVVTNRGTVVIDLLNNRAPCTVNSFVSLANQGFFNNTPCPRVTSSGIYVLQCGDPTGTGSGGPGYKFANENTAGATYPSGTLAMANSGGTDTNGSQFFVVYAPSALSPSYTPFGVVVKGLDIVRNVAEAGNNGSNPAGGGAPAEKISIEKVTISSY